MSSDMGACSGIPDIGAWQFVLPNGLRIGTLSNSPAVSGETESTSPLTGQLGDDIVLQGKLGSEI